MFDTLDTYYQYVESDSKLLLDFNLRKNLISLCEKTDDNSFKTYCSYELFFSDFGFSKGEINAKMTLENGKVYPSLDLFEDDLEYIKLRASSVKNPKYKAKYNNMLWCSNHKNISYVKEAIDNYFQFLKDTEFLVTDNLSNQSFSAYFQNLFALSQKVNYLKEDITQYFLSLLGKEKLSGYQEYSLMKFIVDDGNKISADIFQLFYDYASKLITDSTFPNLEQKLLQLQALLCQKLNIPTKLAYEKLAEFHVRQAENQKGFIAHDYYVKALSAYQKAGNKEKIEEVTILVNEQKKNLDFKTIGVEIDNETTRKYFDAMDKITDSLTTDNESEKIYMYFIHGKIFPKAEVLGQTVKPTLMSLFTTINFDINKNIVGTSKSGIDSYFNHVQNCSLKQLAQIFRKGIQNGKISHETLIDYFQKHTWYGNNFKYVNNEGVLEGFDWIALLSPSLLSFFAQSEIDIKLNKNHYQGYILAIDSLVIKFEGVLREFSRQIGAQTIEVKENGTQERISFEKLLVNPKLTEIIPEDHIALFKFLFTSEGMNLRNNVAHCFYNETNYSPGVMMLLIAAFLKLGNYKFEQKIDETGK